MANNIAGGVAGAIWASQVVFASDCLLEACVKKRQMCKCVQRHLSMIVGTRSTLRSRGVCKACCKLVFLTFSQKATVEAVKELIKKHEEFEKRMNTNDDKINQMMQFAERLNDENHYASDKITEKARSIDERQVAKSFLLTRRGCVSFA